MFSFMHVILVLLVIVLLFGAGKLPKAMGDLGKGIKNLRDELGGGDEPKTGTQEVLPPDDKTPRL